QHNVAPSGDGKCDTKALEENVAFIRRHRITGTPTMIFADGSRAAGAIGKENIEARLERK
ncbi:MAG: thioredoxin fold domain-containing protein, partial [Ottowia sp.]|nr:thioredoxin fold domain-containing protein [Ottowia sp.]